MYTPDQITQAKTRLPIVQYLADKGMMPVKQSGGQYLYFSPFREEKTPSFWVEPNENVWCDFGEDQGDAIRLVMRMDKRSFPSALQFIMGAELHEVNLQFQALDLPSNPQKQHAIQRITAVKDYRLLNYAQSRGISPDILNSFCREVRYQTHKGTFTSIGFKNESEGWELRNERFKGCLGTKDLTLLGNMKCPTVRVFEGFFDFLSYMQLHGTIKLKCSGFVVLNSLSLIPRVIEPLKAFDSILLFLDNDESGRKVTERLKKECPALLDYATMYYPDFKDLNEYLLSKKDEIDKINAR